MGSPRKEIEVKYSDIRSDQEMTLENFKKQLDDNTFVRYDSIGKGEPMNIRFDEQKQLFQINTEHTSYVIGIADGKYVGHVYYGRKIEDLTGIYPLLRTGEAPFVPSVQHAGKMLLCGHISPAEYSTQRRRRLQRKLP